MKKFALLTIGVALIAGLGFVIDSQSRIPVERPASPAQPAAIFAPGRIEAATPEVELRPQLAGRVLEVLVREGQFVEAGAALLRLDDEQYRHQVDLAAADLALANAELDRLVSGARPEAIAEAAALWRARMADLESARLTLRRFNQMLEARAVSGQTADDQRSLAAALAAQTEAAKAHLDQLQAPARREDVAMAQARVGSAAARLELARVQLGRTVLWAPSRGQVLKAEVEAGELTGPDSPEPAVVLADTTCFRVRAFVEEADAPRLQLGMSCRITADGLPGRQLQGRLVQLSPRMSRKAIWTDQPAERFDTKTREAWIELQPTANLVVGLRVDVMIEPQSSRLSVQTFPTSANSPATEALRRVREPLAQTASERP